MHFKIKVFFHKCSVFFKFLSSRSFVKSRRLWDLISIISLTYFLSWSNEISRRNLAEKTGEFRRLPALIYNPVNGNVLRVYYEPIVVHQAGAYPGFYSMKRLGVQLYFYSPPDGMLVHHRITSQYYNVSLPVPIYTPGWREVPWE